MKSFRFIEHRPTDQVEELDALTKLTFGDDIFPLKALSWDIWTGRIPENEWRTEFNAVKRIASSFVRLRVLEGPNLSSLQHFVEYQNTQMFISFVFCLKAWTFQFDLWNFNRKATKSLSSHLHCN